MSLWSLAIFDTPLQKPVQCLYINFLTKVFKLHLLVYLKEMLTAVKHNKDVSVLRRMLFASTYLPEEHPNYWEIIVRFGNKERNAESKKIDEAKLMFQNMKDLDCTAFATDQELIRELLIFQIGNKPLVLIVLISASNTCLVCSSKLLLQKDRPAQVVVYDDIMGSMPGSHYHKYCKNRKCGSTQYYGYYSKGGSPFVYFNPDWKTLPYFFSSKETALSMKLMDRFDAEILVGQLSFKQCADLYNYLHLYEKDHISR